MSGQGRGDRTVKVTIINTKYVETDAVSFKDVVQKMTGKDSRVAYEVQEPPPAVVTSNKSTAQSGNVKDQGLTNGIRSSMTNGNSKPSGVIPRSNSSVMMRNISFKEFDRLFREMPPVEEFWTSELY
ncbi:VQ motif-containing protein 10 [Argentina anserina]|uniref:VQ motif-containing protein 10 n=1 Tax=Argentina anserina TaxID=57926 RepID=UPI0021764401|nr:VQ motif-containing protein 10-like [Potentilla anserina]